MPNVRPLNRKKYNISKRAFQTAYNYCLQYTEWKEELAVKRDTRAGQNLTGQPGSHNCSDSTADAAMEAAEITHKIKKIEDAAMEAVGKEKITKTEPLMISEDFSYYQKEVPGRENPDGR